jgi:hypothetical protein
VNQKTASGSRRPARQELEGGEATPFRALIRLIQQLGHFTRQSRHLLAEDCRMPVWFDSGKDREGLVRDGQESAEIVGHIEGTA